MPVLKFENKYKSIFNQQIPSSEKQIKVIPFFINPEDNNIYIALVKTNDGKRYTFAGSSVLTPEGVIPSQEEFQNTIQYINRFNFDQNMDQYWSTVSQYLNFPVYVQRIQNYIEKVVHVTFAFQQLSINEAQTIASKKGSNVLFQTINIESGYKYNEIAKSFLEQNGNEFIMQILRGIENNIGKKE
jgi:hypothetical protein